MLHGDVSHRTPLWHASPSASAPPPPPELHGHVEALGITHKRKRSALRPSPLSPSLPGTPPLLLFVVVRACCTATAFFHALLCFRFLLSAPSTAGSRRCNDENSDAPSYFSGHPHCSSRFPFCSLPLRNQPPPPTALHSSPFLTLPLPSAPHSPPPPLAPPRSHLCPRLLRHRRPPHPLSNDSHVCVCVLLLYSASLSRTGVCAHGRHR